MTHVHTHGPGGCGHTITLPSMPLPPEPPLEDEQTPDLMAALIASLDAARQQRLDLNRGDSE